MEIMVESPLMAITILDQFEDDGPQQQRFSGFLTSPNNSMFFEKKHLMIVEVEPTNDPSVYRTAGPTMELGRLEDRNKHTETIRAVAESLNNMTAYEFVVKVIMNLKHEVYFEDKIVPIPVILESEVS